MKLDLLRWANRQRSPRVESAVTSWGPGMLRIAFAIFLAILSVEIVMSRVPKIIGAQYATQVDIDRLREDMQHRIDIVEKENQALYTVHNSDIAQLRSEDASQEHDREFAHKELGDFYTRVEKNSHRIDQLKNQLNGLGASQKK